MPRSSTIHGVASLQGRDVAVCRVRSPPQGAFWPSLGWVSLRVASQGWNIYKYIIYIPSSERRHANSIHGRRQEWNTPLPQPRNLWYTTSPRRRGQEWNAALPQPRSLWYTTDPRKLVTNTPAHDAHHAGNTIIVALTPSTIDTMWT